MSSLFLARLKSTTPLINLTAENYKQKHPKKNNKDLGGKTWEGEQRT
jgi:hypothetical protein